MHGKTFENVIDVTTKLHTVADRTDDSTFFATYNSKFKAEGPLLLYIKKKDNCN